MSRPWFCVYLNLFPFPFITDNCVEVMCDQIENCNHDNIILHMKYNIIKNLSENFPVYAREKFQTDLMLEPWFAS